MVWVVLTERSPYSGMVVGRCTHLGIDNPEACSSYLLAECLRIFRLMIADGKWETPKREMRLGRASDNEEQFGFCQVVEA